MANVWARKIGQALRQVRPGLGAVATSRLALLGHGTLAIASPAFADGGALPRRYTQDGDGLFPPLTISGTPERTRSLALLVEDADAPFPRPLVHALVHSIPPDTDTIPEGSIAQRHSRRMRGRFLLGRNSLSREGWLPPSPVPGHGPHRYAFQLLAADAMPAFQSPPSRGQLLRALRPHLLAAARVIGIYQRE